MHARRVVLTPGDIRLTLTAGYGPGRGIFDTVKARPKISLAAATGLLDAVAAAGGNPDRLLRTFGLERPALANPDGFIASSTFALLLERAARETGDDCFGLHF